MTGYSSRSFLLTDRDGKTAEIIITLKTLNNRFFENTYKLFPLFQIYEFEITKLLKESLVRGSVQLTLTTNNPDFFQESVRPALKLAKEYAAALLQVKETLRLTSDLHLDHFVRLPNMFIASEKGLTPEQKTKLFQELELTIQEVMKTRKQEGEMLTRDILSRIDLSMKELEKIKPLFAARISEQKKKVQDTLAEIQSDESVLASSQKSALYTMLDKLDLQEEITRFEGHIKAMRLTIASSAIEKGKRLDFTLQELTREINTVLSKCSDLDISTHGINIKVELEKIREQVQNIL